MAAREAETSYYAGCLQGDTLQSSFLNAIWDLQIASKLHLTAGGLSTMFVLSQC